MKAFVKFVYFSEGKSPAEVEGIMRNHGFTKVKGTSIFEAEASDEAEWGVQVEKLHKALKGQNLFYEPTIGKAPEPGIGPQLSYKERMAKWRDIGLDVDELSDLLQYDSERFKARGLEMMKVQLERVTAERDREIRETEARERIERAREKIMAAVRTEGGQTFQQLSSLAGVDEEILTQMLDDMVKKGKIVAKQSGRRVAYVAV
jgi:lambda repressor-like predicted transcriptional regulator